MPRRSGGQFERAYLVALANEQVSFNEPVRKAKSGRAGRAQRTFRHGIWFDSADEATRHDVLLLQQRAGLIRDLEIKPKFVLLPAFVHQSAGKVNERTWEADWRYRLADGTVVVEDFKGYAWASFRLKLPWILYHLRDVHFYMSTRETINDLYDPSNVTPKRRRRTK